MSETPRADAATEVVDGTLMVSKEFACDLERELNEARAELFKLTTLRPASEHDGSYVMWWDANDLCEGPWMWRYEWHTHWTPLPKVKEPKP